MQNPLTSGVSDIRTWNLGLTGKNYFGDWTFSYDYSKATNYGYASSVHVTNPNILNLYVERRFLKDHRGTFRISAFDLFNENTGFTSSTTASSITETHVNRLSRYYLATFTLRLQKFAGKAPTQEPGQRGSDVTAETALAVVDRVAVDPEARVTDPNKVIDFPVFLILQKDFRQYEKCKTRYRINYLSINFPGDDMAETGLLRFGCFMLFHTKAATL